MKNKENKTAKEIDWRKMEEATKLFASESTKKASME